MPEHPKNEPPGHDKDAEIIVNTRPKIWTEKKISYEQVVKLAFPDDTPSETIVYTVEYRKGEDSKPHGSLVAGESTPVKAGMIFDVVRTDRS